MASRRKKGAPIVALDDDAAFVAAVEQSTKFLVVVDIHQGWCGPCTTMEPIYNKAFIELDRAEDRVKFFTIDAEKLSAESKKGLPVTESCKPLFVVFKVRLHRPPAGPSPPPPPTHAPLPPPPPCARAARAEQGARNQSAGRPRARAGDVDHG
jgi:thiol-disulfide isomerase/thioredoxin